MIFYFSGTGNSRWIASQLSEVQQEQLIFIPKAMKNSVTKYELLNDEKIGFVFPIYSWGPPSLIIHFLQQLYFSNYNGQYLFFVCSCGDDIGLTRQVFCKAIGKKGWECNAGFSVIMPNNYVLLPGFNTDPKEIEQCKLKDSKIRVAEINRKILGKEMFFDCNEGIFPFIKTRVINPLFNYKGISPSKFYVSDACIACKRCEKVCPMENIEIVGGRPVWRNNCTSCLACYHICPRHAVEYGKVTRKKGQYFYPDNKNESVE